MNKVLSIEDTVNRINSGAVIIAAYSAAKYVVLSARAESIELTDEGKEAALDTLVHEGARFDYAQALGLLNEPSFSPWVEVNA